MLLTGFVPKRKESQLHLAVVGFGQFLHHSYNLRGTFTGWLRLEGNSGGLLVQPPLQAGLPTAGWTGPCPCSLSPAQSRGTEGFTPSGQLEMKATFKVDKCIFEGEKREV